MSLGFTAEKLIPVQDIYVVSKVGGEYSSLPVVFLAVKKLSGMDDEVVPMHWDLSSSDWKDSRTAAGFLAIVKSKSLEAHYQATQQDLERELVSHEAHLTTAERDHLYHTKIIEVLMTMIAHKRVRNVLAAKLPGQ